MIDNVDALAWMYFDFESQLSNASRYAINQIANPSTSAAQHNLQIANLLETARQFNNVLEYAEIAAIVGNIQAKYGNPTEAFAHFKAAEAIFRQQSCHFSHAAMQWLQARSLWATEKNLTAYDLACSARRTMAQAGKASPAASSAKACLQKMDASLASTPEEAYFWLGKFDGSYLTGQCAKFVDVIRQAIAAQESRRAFELISTMQVASKSNIAPLENAEALAFCGLAAYHLGNLEMAIKLLRQSASLYQPDHYQHAIVRWMLGMIAFSQKPVNPETIVICQRAIAALEQLKKSAQQKNRPHQAQWYDNCISLMTAALQERMSAVRDV